MNSRKSINFFFAIVAIILGWTLVKHFDGKTFRFADPLMDVLYLIVFLISIYFLVKEYRKQP